MKGFFRFISALTASVMLVASCMVTSASAENSVEDAEQSVVLVASSIGKEYGSGFAVGKPGENPKYIITNCHVITDDNDRVYDDLTVFFSAAAHKYVSAEVVAADTNKDLCVLELPEPTSERKPITLCKSENVSKGDEVFVLGYPAYSLVGKNYTTFDTKDITSAKGSISQKTRVNNSGAIGTNVFMTDTIIDNGNSGGPMINAKGEAIGIATWGIEMKDESGNKRTDGGYAVMVDELIPMLNSNNIPYMLSTDVPSGNGESVPVSGEPSTPTNNNTMIIVIAAVAAVVVAGAVTAVIVVSKKKKTAQPVLQQIQSPVPAPRRGAVITGVKGIMSNRDFPVNGSVIIGRNSQKCNVCFPVDTKGISGTHCQIRQVSNGYEIVDLGSSNGTFLGSGQRLTPDVPVIIPDGTYFYLGSAEQLFQIKY